MSSTAPAVKPKILFIHRVNGAQFEFFGAWLSENGWDVCFLYDEGNPDSAQIGQACSRTYSAQKCKARADDYLHILEFSAHNAFGALEAMTRMRNFENYTPDIVMAHVGWGVGLCVKQVWPGCCYIAYHEWFYTNIDWEHGAKLEGPTTTLQQIGSRMRNLVISAEFDNADAHWSPTRFQAGRFPPLLRKQIRVMPDGVDCAALAPPRQPKISFDWLDLPAGTPIVTYMTRGFEPIRGFPQFMKALKRLQTLRQDFHTIIVGQDHSFYQGSSSGGKTWRMQALDELELDQSRIHFQTTRSKKDFHAILHASSVHCYFSEPFVTSWSLFEALAAGCLVVGSDTGTVRELISDMKNGILVDMNDTEEVAEMLDWALSNPDKAAKLRIRAREKMLKLHDAAVVFPEKAELLRKLMAKASGQNR